MTDKKGTKNNPTEIHTRSFDRFRKTIEKGRVTALIYASCGWYIKATTGNRNLIKVNGESPPYENRASLFLQEPSFKSGTSTSPSSGTGVRFAISHRLWRFRTGV